MAKEYELLSAVDFGTLKDENDRPLPEEEQPSPHGLKSEGEKVTLEDEVAEPLLEARVIKPAGEDLPLLSHDNPEELGYEGEEARDADLDKSQDEAQSNPPSEAPSSEAPKSAKGPK